MKNKTESTLDIQYVKPGMIDLGAAVTITGAACGSTGSGANDNCFAGSIAQDQCGGGSIAYIVPPTCPGTGSGLETGG